jgi:hypothetical protein
VAQALLPAVGASSCDDRPTEYPSAKATATLAPRRKTTPRRRGGL